MVPTEPSEYDFQIEPEASGLPVELVGRVGVDAVEVEAQLLGDLVAHGILDAVEHDAERPEFFGALEDPGQNAELVDV